MNPLARQDSRPSLLSYWSDSNRGPTINLHAVAKPLMRRMYHRQALEIIRKNCGNSLSRDALETYSSYFPWDYVSRGTKIAILSELTNRTESDVEARAVVDSPVLYCIAQMLWWPDIEMRSASCMLLGNLASHECTAPAILKLDLCEQLVSLVGEDDFQLTRAAQGVLCHIAQRLDGAQAIVEAPILDHVLELLESPRWVVRDVACDLVKKLAQHDSILLAILKSKACVLLMDEYLEVALSPWNALSSVAQRLDAEPAIASKALDYIPALLESSKPEVRSWACDRVGGFARHESILSAVLESKAFARLLSLLHDEHPEVVQSATEVVSQIAEKLEGAQAIVKAKLLDNVSKLIESLCLSNPCRACTLIEGLIYHESLLPAVLESKAFARLLSLLHNEYPEVVQSATKALSRIAEKLEGAQAIVEAKVLDNVLELIESSCLPVRNRACDLIEALVHHESILLAILESKTCVRLVAALLREAATSTYPTFALCALHAIRAWPVGAAALIDMPFKYG